MERFARILVERDPRSRRLVKAVGSAVVVYASALIGVQITELGGAGAWGVVVVHAALVIVLVAVTYTITALVEDVASELSDHRRHLLRRAEREATRAVTQAHRELAALCRRSPGQVPYTPHPGLPIIEAEVSALYRTLDGSQDGHRIPGTGVDFQVTFMTRSYRDGKITIAAWANRMDRRPLSLEIRRDNPDIYDQTVTAELYRAGRPEAQLVESTTLAGFDYRPLYPGEKGWIQSTIVYPVLDLSNKLVGTLVVTCNREGFFRQRDYGFWCELLEPFASRIALEKQRLDETVLLSGDAASAVSTMPAPF